MEIASVIILVTCSFMQTYSVFDTTCIDQSQVHYVHSLLECVYFTKNVKGLAFNYGSSIRGQLSYNKDNSENGTLFPRKSARRHMVSQPEEFYNCIALDCPETLNFTTMIEDPRFDYYSLYTNPPPPSNSTCLPQIGMFQFNSSPLTFQKASTSCLTESRGALAHVISEARTNLISNFLSGMYDRSKDAHLAYVGLNFSKSMNRGEFMTPEWESLKCFLYRAWAPGYPKEGKNSSCVAITRGKSWITTDCRRKLPSICEIYTTGPSWIRKRGCY